MCTYMYTHLQVEVKDNTRGIAEGMWLTPIIGYDGSPSQVKATIFCLPIEMCQHGEKV